MIEVISFGAGKQTVYLTITALEGNYDKEVDKIYFSNIMGCELKATMDYLDWFNDYINKRFNKNITVINSPSLYDDLINYVNGKTKRCSNIPLYTLNTRSAGVINRECTPDYKISPIDRQIKKDFGKKIKANVWLGISYDELQRTRESNKNWKTNYYPLVLFKIKLYDIIKWFQIHGIPIPPKSSCTFCPFHSDEYWIELFIYYPAEFEKAVILDRLIRHFPGLQSECYLHPSCKPLEEIIVILLANKEKAKEQKNLFSKLDMINECYAYCGT